MGITEQLRDCETLEDLAGELFNALCEIGSVLDNDDLDPSDPDWDSVMEARASEAHGLVTGYVNAALYAVNYTIGGWEKPKPKDNAPMLGGK